MKPRLAIPIVLLSLLLGACSSLLGPREVELPLPRLQAALERRFPFSGRFLEIFDVYASNPRLSLDPERNRLAIMVDATIAPPFLDRQFKGHMALSGALAIDPQRNAVILTDPRLDDLAIDGMQAPLTRQLARVGAVLAEQMLRDIPVYTFGPDDFRHGGLRFLPTAIATRASGLVVTFEPAR